MLAASKMRTMMAVSDPTPCCLTPPPVNLLPLMLLPYVSPLCPPTTTITHTRTHTHKHTHMCDYTAARECNSWTSAVFALMPAFPSQWLSRAGTERLACSQDTGLLESKTCAQGLPPKLQKRSSNSTVVLSLTLSQHRQANSPLFTNRSFPW